MSQITPENENENKNEKEELSWDIIAHEILPRVNPLKSLTRCKSVSKQWNNHISSQEFFPQLNPLFGYFTNTIPVKQVFHSLKNGPLSRSPSSYFLGSSNGVVLLGKIHVPCSYEDPLFLWNPSSDSTTIITKGYTQHSFACAFGFGFYNGDHKIVQICYKCSSSELENVAVYHQKRNRWKTCDARKVSLGIGGDNIVAVFWLWSQSAHDGKAIYWLAKTRDATWVVVGFDFSEEGFVHVALPEGFERDREKKKVSLATLAVGNLVTVLKYPLKGFGECEVWVLKSENWVRILVDSIWIDGYNEWPLGFLNKGEFLIRKYGKKIVSCDVRTKKKRTCLEIEGVDMIWCVASDFVDNK